MSNFHFLQAEFKELFDNAQAVEPLVHSDPRAACIRARHALEVTVHWLYTVERKLRTPYDRSLNALLSEQDFRHLLGETVWQKAKALQRYGNEAAHGNKTIKPYQAQQLCGELFHLLYWLARTYSRSGELADVQFDAAKLPRLVKADDAVRFTKTELEKQEAKFRAEMAEKQAAAEAREQAVEARVTAKLEAEATEHHNLLEEREKALAAVNAELAAMREQVAAARASNEQLPDNHDYDEFTTRKLIIDVLLSEAGWAVGKDAGEEVPVTGMRKANGEGSGNGYVDYVLWGKNGKPLAVVEAKRALKDPNIGQQQAKLYADCLEKMTGQRPLIFYTNGYRTWLWDDKAAPPREVQGVYRRSELELAIQRRAIATDPSKLSPNKEIAGRFYQARAIKSISEALNSGQRSALLTMATGTGKTRTAIALVDVLMRANLVKTVLFLADRTALVKQAANAFKEHLPAVATVNLVTEKNGSGRVYCSTYPTMMNLIEPAKRQTHEERLFGIGAFDLVIIDEAHRSVYQKYQTIFNYFDSYLVGLTATPRDEVHRDTYALFGLEKGVPTDTYSLEEAVADGFLVPPKAVSVPLKFVREGIRYDELSDEEKEHWDSLEWNDENETPDEVSASAINKQLFNNNTVDQMLAHLMANGLLVNGGDRLGKTIVFAVNQNHANFIAERFDQNYPHLNGHFARVVTHSVSHAQTLIDDFGKKNGNPHIAISVDMLDTGIDVPEVLNLVFFKAVRSKVKFLQMIGRGTRLCEDLFAPDSDKTEFFIFDYCCNFEYFNEVTATAEASAVEPLGKRLLRTRAELLAQLQKFDADSGGVKATEAPATYPSGLEGLRSSLEATLHGEVSAMNLNNFLVRPHGEHVARFTKPESWEKLDDEALGVIATHIAGLPAELEPDHVTAKLFDLTCLELQTAVLAKSPKAELLQNRISELACQLEGVNNVPAVQAQLTLIQAVQGDEYWQDITLPMIEELRRQLRGLIKLIEKKKQKIVYSSFTDEMGDATAVTLDDFSTGINLEQYRRKVERFIQTNANHITIAKLHRNLPLTTSDLQQLEQFVYSSAVVESRERFEQSFGQEKSLPLFIRSLVGMDINAAKKAFSAFLNETTYSATQIRYINIIVDQLAKSGIVEPGQLYEAPFTAVHHEGLDGVFGDKDADNIVHLLKAIEENTSAAA